MPINLDHLGELERTHSCGELRRSAPDLRVDVYPEADKLGKQLKYASTRGVPFVVVIGEEERARGQVALKDMKTGEQRTLNREQAGAEIRDALRLSVKGSHTQAAS